MSSAFLALWNDFPATLTDEYEAWHSHEHVPERLTTPGMGWARRYGTFARPDNRYFTLYGLEDVKVLEQPAYLDLIRRPTDWSFSMRRHFLNVLRIPAIDFASQGRGLGGGLIAQAYSVEKSAAHTRSATLAGVLQRLTLSGYILGFRIGLAEPNQPYEVFQQADVTNSDTLNVVVLIEGTTREMLEDVYEHAAEASTHALRPQGCLRSGVFNLLVSYQGTEPAGGREAVAVSGTMRSRFASSELTAP